MKNWKKTGISRAWFQKIRVCRENLKTPMAQAAYQYMMQHNPFYAEMSKEQGVRIQQSSALTISSYDLFIVYHGIECAIFPELYPTADFSDTGITEMILQGLCLKRGLLRLRCRSAAVCVLAFSSIIKLKRRMTPTGWYPLVNLSRAKHYRQSEHMESIAIYSFCYTRSIWPPCISKHRCGPAHSDSLLMYLLAAHMYLQDIGRWQEIH